MDEQTSKRYFKRIQEAIILEEDIEQLLRESQRAGFDINFIPRGEKNSLLRTAIYFDASWTAVRALIKAGADVNDLNLMGKDALLSLIETRDVGAVPPDLFRELVDLIEDEGSKFAAFSILCRSYITDELPADDINWSPINTNWDAVLNAVLMLVDSGVDIKYRVDMENQTRAPEPQSRMYIRRKRKLDAAIEAFVAQKKEQERQLNNSNKSNMDYFDYEI